VLKNSNAKNAQDALRAQRVSFAFLAFFALFALIIKTAAEAYSIKEGLVKKTFDRIVKLVFCKWLLEENVSTCFQGNVFY
jgi:hypothetical protein